MNIRTIGGVMTAILLSCALAAPAGATTAGPGGTAVEVDAIANARVECSAIEGDRIAVRANAAWMLTAEAPGGTTTIVGGKTGPTPRSVRIPRGVTAFTLMLVGSDTAR
jgi:hypothetical protein